MNSVMPGVLISIVIPVKNGEVWLDQSLAAMQNQTLAGETEIIAIDSGSADQSRAILADHGATVLSIPASEFNHGLTRMKGVAAARGKYVVMTVQDARPADSHWLESLLAGFLDDEVAGVCGQQIVPHDTDKNPVQWFRPVSPPSVKRIHFPHRRDFELLSPREKKELCSWDDVNAMYRKDILLKIPFREIIFGEDMQWAKDALGSGFALVHNNHAKVEHYHAYTKESAFSRQFIENYTCYQLFGLVPEATRDSLIDLARNIRLLAGVKGMNLAEKWRWLRYNQSMRRVARESDQLFLETLRSGPDQLDLLQARLFGRAAAAEPKRI